MKRRAILMTILVVAIFMSTLESARADRRCPNGRSSEAAMWLSIAHPGLGEYHLKGWGPWSNMPQRKFWMGFIPGYGWPGYLQVKSALDAANCRTNDDLVFKD